MSNKPDNRARALEKPTSLTWQQQAGFSLFFDYRYDQQGEQRWQTRVWQTRVWHQESDKEELFSGIAPLPWVEWILKQADLIALADATPIPSAGLVPMPPSATSDTKLEILESSVEVLEPGPEVAQRMLAMTIRFRIAGMNVGAVAESEVPYQVELHLIDLDRGTVNLVSSERDRLRSETFDYASRQIVALPAVGRYELQAIVLLLPPAAILTLHAGPTIQVIP